MKLYKELIEAVTEVVSGSIESTVFKNRFSKLIENFYEDSYAERDINDVIDQVNLVEDNINGN
jgi:hypothetical protein